VREATASQEAGWRQGEVAVTAPARSLHTLVTGAASGIGLGIARYLDLPHDQKIQWELQSSCYFDCNGNPARRDCQDQCAGRGISAEHPGQCSSRFRSVGKYMESVPE
jgi:hypothetical protein